MAWCAGRHRSCGSAGEASRRNVRVRTPRPRSIDRSVSRRSRLTASVRRTARLTQRRSRRAVRANPNPHVSGMNRPVGERSRPGLGGPPNLMHALRLVLGDRGRAAVERPHQPLAGSAAGGVVGHVVEPPPAATGRTRPRATGRRQVLLRRTARMWAGHADTSLAPDNSLRGKRSPAGHGAKPRLPRLAREAFRRWPTRG